MRGCCGAAVGHSAGAAAGPTGAVVELAGAAVGLLRGCWGRALTGPLGALKGPLGAQEGSPGPLGGAQCPAGGRSILDRSLIDPKVAESVFAGDVEQNVVG